ncbi:MAG: CoA pyrophosphatase [Pseudomonadota bacterium]
MVSEIKPISLTDVPPRLLAIDHDGEPPSQPTLGDHDLNPDMPPLPTLRDAAVLVPLINRPSEPTVLLTVRTEHLKAHAGQISFPGGRIEDGDSGPLAAALRETKEEVGISSDRIDIVGRLNTYITRTGFRIQPYVGVMEPPVDITPDPFEVADTFEVPLSFILSRDMPRRHARTFQGRERYFYVFTYQDRYIWGATAGMLRNLKLLLDTP